MAIYKSTNFWLVVVLLILAASAGFLIGYALVNKPGSSTTPGLTATDNKLFTQQSAQIRGIITKVSGRTLTVENSLKVKGDITTAERLTVFDPKNKIATSSANLDKLELNRDVTINLIKLKDGYKAFMVNYINVSTPAPAKKK